MRGTDAERRYLERIAADIEPLLRPGVELRGLEIVDGSPPAVRCRYAMGAVEQASEGSGSTIVEAHAELRRRIVEDRIGLALRALTASAGVYSGASVVDAWRRNPDNLTRD